MGFSNKINLLIPLLLLIVEMMIQITKLQYLFETQLEKAAKGTIAEFLSLISDVKDFVNSLPQPLIDCINTNAEVDELAIAYNIKGADPAAIEKKIISYFTLHFLAVHKWMVDLDNLWYAGKYYEFGFNGAGYAHQMLGMNLIKYIKSRIN